jgi:hypothetical protein
MKLTVAFTVLILHNSLLVFAQIVPLTKEKLEALATSQLLVR